MSCNLSLAMHDLANDICSQTSKTVFSHLRQLQVNLKKICGTFTSLTTRTKLQTSKALNATKHFSLMRMSTQESIFEFAMTAELKKEDAFFTALASIWSNIFTNSKEKKTCLLLCLFKFQTHACQNFWIFCFTSRLTLYECVVNVYIQR